MIVTVITLIISFLLQGIVSNYLEYSYFHLSWFFTVYPLINLLVLVPYFDNRKKCIILVLVVGLFIDILYSNILFLNVFICLIIYVISKLFHFFFPYNLFTINISNLFSILLYHILTFIILWIFQYNSYNIFACLKILSHSIIMTLIYSSIIYLIIKYIFERFELREIR